MSLRIEPLKRFHDRKSFSCSDAQVDLFLREKAMQDGDRRLSRTLVLVDTGNPEHIVGFYTLIFTEVPQAAIPNDRPKIKRRIPIILLGQIGIDVKFQGRGLGDMLLLDAQSRVYEMSKSVGIKAMLLDARTEQLADWYESNDFVRFPDSLRMIKHIDEISKIFE